MSSGRLLCFLLFAVGSVVVCRGLDVPICPKVRCSCPDPNGMIGDAVKMDDDSNGGIGCLCTCGREEGAECTSDDHCAKGTTCTYGKQLSKTGTKRVCTNKCSLTTCPQYNRCDLVLNEPVCSYRRFDCSSNVIFPISAVCDNDMKSFNNLCEMANANFDRQALKSGSSVYAVSK